MRRLVGWIGIAASLGMFLVLAMGALVTNTASGKGCGSTWPLCNGRFIPEIALATVIEWSHRFVTGIESLFILALSAGALILYRRYREVQILVPAMLLFLVAQAVLGALAALYPEPSAVLALHFGVSLISFATVVLTTAFVREHDGADILRDRPTPTRTRALIWGTLVYVYLVVYLGAYVRHSGASLACTSVPFCTGTSFGNLALWPVLVHLAHRAAAGLLVLLTFALWLITRRDRAERPDLYRGSSIALACVALQAVCGVFVVLTRLSLFSTLVHAALASLIFVSLSYCAYHLIPHHAPATRRRGVRVVRTTATIGEMGAD